MRFLERHDKTALIWQDQAYSYDQLLSRVGAFARQLPAAPGDRVVIFAENRCEWAFAFYAVWRLGAIAVPVDALCSADEVAHILRDAEPSVACFSETTRAVFAEALVLVEKKPAAFTLEELAAAEPAEPEALPAGRWFPRMFRPIEVTFLPPVQPGEETYDELAERVQAAVAGKLG